MGLRGLGMGSHGWGMVFHGFGGLCMLSEWVFIVSGSRKRAAEHTLGSLTFPGGPPGQIVFPGGPAGTDYLSRRALLDRIPFPASPPGQIIFPGGAQFVPAGTEFVSAGRIFPGAGKTRGRLGPLWEEKVQWKRKYSGRESTVEEKVQ